MRKIGKRSQAEPEGADDVVGESGYVSPSVSIAHN